MKNNIFLEQIIEHCFFLSKIVNCVFWVRKLFFVIKYRKLFSRTVLKNDLILCLDHVKFERKYMGKKIKEIGGKNSTKIKIRFKLNKILLHNSSFIFYIFKGQVT